MSSNGLEEKPLTVEKRLTLTKFEVYEKPHIIVDTEKCRKCETKPCIKACPAGLYSLDEEGKLSFVYEGCLECGTCRIICPHEAVSWSYPPGGYGVWYKFG
ncbi:MAG: ferredoxin family protein [Desulfurococcales archaeon]|nr:ferredoxin family protein [Desulfurococcales archaeon]